MLRKYYTKRENQLPPHLYYQTCSICKSNNKRKGKWTGATAGCALEKCKKTFHYYCAKKDNTASTQRYNAWESDQPRGKPEVWYRSVYTCTYFDVSFTLSQIKKNYLCNEM